MAGYGISTGPTVSAVPHDARPQQPAPPKAPTKGVAQKLATDPFAPMTPAQIQATVQKYTAGYGTPQTPGQIQSSAQSMIDPIIAAISANISGQTKTASENIRGNAGSLASSLAGVDYGAPYAGAEGKQAAIDAALQQSLTGGGQALASGLESRLSGIGGGSVQSTASGLAGRAAAIGTNEQAVGSAGLTNLVANEAAAKAYGQKLPGIAQMQGLQGISGVEQAGVKTLGDQTSQVMQQLPSIVENLRNAAQTLTGQKAAAAAALYETLTGQNITKATASAGLRGAQTKAAAPDATLSRAYGYAVDSNGNPVGGTKTPLPGYQVGPDGNVVKTPKPAPAAKPLSTSDKNRLNTLAHTLYNGVAQHVHYVSTGAGTGKWVPVPGTGQPPATWSQAVSQLVQGGDTVASAVARLNAQGWKPGEGGRPLTPAQIAAQKKTAAAVKSGLGLPADPYAKYGH